MTILSEYSPLMNRFFSDDGLPTGDLNINKDGSSVNKDYYVTALQGEKFSLAEAVIHIRTSDPGGVIPGGYGHLAALANGFQIFIYRSSIDTYFDITDGFPLKRHEDWGRWSDPATPINYSAGSGKTPVFAAVWSLLRYGKHDGLVLNEGDKLGIRLRDSLVGLDEQTILVKGVHLKSINPLWLQIMEAI